VHQYDNALDFLQLNGITRGVLPALNSTNIEVTLCFLQTTRPFFTAVVTVTNQFSIFR